MFSSLFANPFGGPQLLLILIVGVLLFGKRLPEIGRSLGKGLTEFKKGLHGLEDELDLTGRNAGPPMHQQTAAPQQVQAPQRVAATAPKFEEDLPNISTPPRA